MGYVLKRLALGIALIGLAAAVLLLSDWQHRQRARPSGSSLVAMVDAANSNHADLILLTSTPTLQAAAQRIKNIPIIFSVVANPKLAGIGPSFAEHAPNITGICTMSDFETMGGIIRECLPHARRLGTLFASGEDNCIYNKDAMAVVVVCIGLYLFFRTNLGTAMRATGNNPQMIRALGVNTDTMIVIGLAQFNEVRRTDQLDPGTAEMLQALYV